MVRRHSLRCAIGLSALLVVTLTGGLEAGTPLTVGDSPESFAPAVLETLGPLSLPAAAEMERFTGLQMLLFAPVSTVEFICGSGGLDLSAGLVLASAMCIPEPTARWGDLASVGSELIRTLSAPGAVIKCHK